MKLSLTPCHGNPGLGNHGAGIRLRGARAMQAASEVQAVPYLPALWLGSQHATSSSPC